VLDARIEYTRLAPGIVHHIRPIELADVYRIISRVLPYVPLRWAYGACERMEWMAHYTPAWPRIMGNLAHVVPNASNAQRERYARQVFSGLLKNYYDLLRSHALSSTAMLSMTGVQGLENMRAALAHGRGALVAMPHIGSLSLVAEPIAMLLDRRITVVVEKMSNPALHDLINSLRRREHITVLETGPSVARALMRTLRNGEIVVLPSDRTVAEATVNVPFFGAPTSVPAGPAALALRTGAPLLTAYTYRQPDHRSIVVIDPALAIERSGEQKVDIQRIMAVIMRIFEAYIRRHPGQWLLTEPVWAQP
jgi:lauroyl/myristoyl acyltransferase